MSLDVLLDQSHLVLREISRLDHSASTQKFRKMRTLASRCSADIDNIIILLRIRRLRDAHRTDILHIEPAVLKRGEPRQMVKFRDYKRIRNLFDPLCLYAFLLQTLLQFLRRTFLRIRADRNSGRRRKCLQHRLRLFISVIRRPAVNDPLWNRIFYAVIREPDFFPTSCHTSQNTIHKA